MNPSSSLQLRSVEPYLTVSNCCSALLMRSCGVSTAIDWQSFFSRVIRNTHNHMLSMLS